LPQRQAFSKTASVTDEPTNHDQLDDELRALAAPSPDLVDALLRAQVSRALFATDDTLPSVGRFEIRGVLGRGMTIVYDAWDPRLLRRVALKLVPANEDEHDRVYAEARALAKLQHPHVVTVHDAELIGDEVAIALEWIDGSDLRSYQRTAAPSPAEALRLVIEAGRGLVAAHAAGLVHRDVKPENILVGTDGRARISDFGLARSGAMYAGGTTPAGTPGYMAPEQRDGGAIDARTDQVGFAITVAEVWSSTGATMPRDLAAALARGRADVADDRFPAMADFVAELDRVATGPARRRRRLALGGLVAILAVAVVAIWFAWPRASSQPCLAAIGTPAWNAAREARIRAAMGTNSLASSTMDRVAASLAHYQLVLTDAGTAACTVDSAPRAARTTCLARSVRRVDELLAELEHPDPAVIEHAVSAVLAATDISECSDAPPVPDPNAPNAAVIAGLRAKLDTAQMLEDAGLTKRALAVSMDVAAAAEPLGDHRLLGEAWYRVGVERATVRAPEADVAQRRAASEAEAAGDDSIAAQAWIRLISVARATKHYEDADAAAMQAKAKLTRIGAPPALAGFLQMNLGLLAEARNDLAGARTAFERCLALYEPLGTDRPRVVGALTTLSRILDKQGEREQAAAAVKRAAEIAARVYGPDHPSLADVLLQQADVAMDADDLTSARDAYLRAVAIREAAQAPTIQIAFALNSLAGAYSALGDHAAALATLQRVLALKEQAEGKTSPALVSTLINLAQTVVVADSSAARAYLERAAAIVAIEPEPDRVRDTPLVELGLGDVDVEQRSFDAAIEHVKTGRDGLSALLGPAHPKVASANVKLAQIYLDASRPADAVLAIDAVTDIHGRTPYDVAYGELIAAQAHFRAHDRERALELASSAADHVATVPGAAAADLAKKIAAWRASPN
jgi:tetratricopeptide (TPR) repeat protein